MQMINIKPKELINFALTEITIKYLTKYEVVYLKKSFTVSTGTYQLLVYSASSY